MIQRNGCVRDFGGQMGRELSLFAMNWCHWCRRSIDGGVRTSMACPIAMQVNLLFATVG
jgi:hypothetical protein